MSGPDDGAADVWGNNNLVWRSMSEWVMCLDRPVGPDGYSPWQVGCSFPNCILVWYTMYISSKDNTTDTDMIPNKITPISSRHFLNLCTIYWFYLLAVVFFLSNDALQRDVALRFDQQNLPLQKDSGHTVTWLHKDLFTPQCVANSYSPSVVLVSQLWWEICCLCGRLNTSAVTARLADWKGG